MFIKGPWPVMVNIPPWLAGWLLGHTHVLKQDPLSESYKKRKKKVGLKANLFVDFLGSPAALEEQVSC